MGTENELETIMLSREHLDYLDQLGAEMNPDMPPSFALPHLIRAILDRFEESGIDLTGASSEEEIAQLAAGQLRTQTYDHAPRLSGRAFSSNQSRQAARRSYRSSLPAKDRLRSGTPPRSGRG